MLCCKVLGTIRAFDAEGEELVLASRSQRRLLAILCLRSNSVVRSVVLEEHLGLSGGALRTSISRLRRVIGAECLVTGAAGYQLRADVDVGEFERLVTESQVSSGVTLKSSQGAASTARKAATSTRTFVSATGAPPP